MCQAVRHMIGRYINLASLSLDQLQLSESQSSLMLSSTLLRLLSSSKLKPKSDGSESWLERIGIHKPFTRCHPWPIGDG